jgi:hypothetical protein
MELDRGVGVSVQSDSALTLERTSVSRCHAAGIFAEQGTFQARDVVVHDIDVRESDSALGRGVVLQDLAMVDAERLHVERVFENGVLFGGVLPSFGTVRDLTILNVRVDRLGERFGRGITIQSRSDVDLSRVRIENVIEAGIINGANADIRDLVVRGVSPGVNGLPRGGFGLATLIRAHTLIARALFEDTVIVGIITNGTDAHLDATDVRISDVASIDCDGTVACAPGGHAFAAYLDATATIERFDLGPADVCGFHAALGGSVVARNGSVHDSAIGACIQSERQSVDDLQTNVRYFGNDTPLESTMLPVPMLGDEAL